MKQNIIRLIENDLKMSLFIHCLKSQLDIHADGISTDNILVILSLMRIRPNDEVLNRYFDLIHSVNEAQSPHKREQLPHVIFDFLHNCQHNPELISPIDSPLQLGVFRIAYSS